MAFSNLQRSFATRWLIILNWYANTRKIHYSKTIPGNREKISSTKFWCKSPTYRWTKFHLMTHLAARHSEKLSLDVLQIKNVIERLYVPRNACAFWVMLKNRYSDQYTLTVYMAILFSSSFWTYHRHWIFINKY